MLKKLCNQKFPIVVIAVLSLWLAVLPTVRDLMNVDPTNTNTAVTTTCQQARVLQLQLAQNCQSANSYQNYNAITMVGPNLQNFISLLTFLFIMAAISMAPISRLFKPPKINLS